MYQGPLFYIYPKFCYLKSPIWKMEWLIDRSMQGEKMTKLLKRTLMGILLLVVCAPLCAMHELSKGGAGVLDVRVTPATENVESTVDPDYEKEGFIGDFDDPLTDEQQAKLLEQNDQSLSGEQQGILKFVKSSLLRLPDAASGVKPAESPTLGRKQNNLEKNSWGGRPYVKLGATLVFGGIGVQQIHRTYSTYRQEHLKRKSQGKETKEGFVRWWYRRQMAWLRGVASSSR